MFWPSISPTNWNIFSSQFTRPAIQIKKVIYLHNAWFWNHDWYYIRLIFPYGNGAGTKVRFGSSGLIIWYCYGRVQPCSKRKSPDYMMCSPKPIDIKESKCRKAYLHHNLKQPKLADVSCRQASETMLGNRTQTWPRSGGGRHHGWNKTFGVHSCAQNKEGYRTPSLTRLI